MIAGFLAVLEIKPARFPVAAVEKQCGKAVFHLPPAVGSAEEQKVIASVAAVDPQPLIIRLGKDTVFQISDGSQGKAFAPEDILSVELLASFARHDFLLVLHDEKALHPLLIRDIGAAVTIGEGEAAAAEIPDGKGSVCRCLGRVEPPHHPADFPFAEIKLADSQIQKIHFRNNHNTPRRLTGPAPPEPCQERW